MWYKVFIPELKDDITGVNYMFYEIIPEYTEEYYNLINSLKIEIAKVGKNIESYTHLAGTN